MHLLHVQFNMNCVLIVSNERKVQNQYMKEMLSKVFDRNKLHKTFLVNMKNHKNKKRR